MSMYMQTMQLSHQMHEGHGEYSVLAHLAGFPEHGQLAAGCGAANSTA